MLLDIQNLSVRVNTALGDKTLVDNITLGIEPRTIAALVGGSGSGKTTTGLGILRLLAPGLRIEHGNSDGHILFNGTDLLGLSESRMREVRGKEISMIFQEPLNAFNPVFTIGAQIEEVLKYHTNLLPKQRRCRAREILDVVGISEPERVAESYPHQLSGGMRQRAMIAQAIVADPKLIIADEPTSNLDVTLQARIMELFKDLRDRLGLSILLITHDLGVVRHLAERISVMSEGKIVESGKTTDVLTNPGHEYTRRLMDAAR